MMMTIVGIRFKDSGKIYYFDPGELALEAGDMVIVDTARGPEMARIVFGRREVPQDELVGELKAVLRHVESRDYERMATLQARHDDVLARCGRKIAEHSLPMKLVKAEYSFDGSRLTFYFTAENRVDFRLLVRDLARMFRSRIELRQIGPRDEAKLLGGIGPCGRLLCCATFLPDYARVTIKMAKDQDLPLNPAKISGVCGRLLCCLSYEHQQYVEMKAELPRKDAWVHTPDGPGTVVAVNVLKSSMLVRLASSDMEEEYTLTQVNQAEAGVEAVAQQRTQAGNTPAARVKDVDSWLEAEGLTSAQPDAEQPGTSSKGRRSKRKHVPATPPQAAAAQQRGAAGTKKRDSTKQKGRKPQTAASRASDTAPAPPSAEAGSKARPRRRKRKRSDSDSDSGEQ